MRSLLLLPLLLSACGAVVVVPGAPVSKPAAGRAERVLAECLMLERAHQTLQERRQPAPADILVGCPGHEGKRDEMPLKAQSEALRRANAAELPPNVRAQGASAARIYRRMITRGVPESLAREMAEGQLFAAAAGK